MYVPGEDEKYNNHPASEAVITWNFRTAMPPLPLVAAAVVEVQGCVDDDINAGEVEVLFTQWTEAGIKVGSSQVQLCHASVDQPDRP